MLFLVLLQSLMLIALLGFVLYSRLQTGRTLDRLSALDGERSASLRNLHAAVAAFQSELREIQDQRSQGEEERRLEIAPVLSATALTIGKRSQAMKMIRRGESEETVAAAIGVPQNQIRLLRKVHALIDPAGAPR
jgi:hypothetical protein